MFTSLAIEDIFNFHSSMFFFLEDAWLEKITIAYLQK